MPKPRRQTGRIYHAKDAEGRELRGVWLVEWDYGDGTVKGRRRRKKTIHGNQAAALKYLRDRLKEVDEGRAVARSAETVGVYLDRWFAALDTSRTAPRTRERYRKLIDQHIKPGIGDVRLQDLDAEALATFYADRRERGRMGGKKGGLSPTTVKQMHAILHRALRSAARAHLIPRNPLDDLDERPQAAAPDARRLTTDEVNAICAAVQASKRTNLYLPVILAATTGMRRGEVLALRWQDVDLRLGMARVTRALYKAEGELRFKAPKTKQARTVALPAPALGALRARWNEREKLRREIDGFDDGGLVCTRINWKTGKAAEPIDPDTVSSSFTHFCARHGFGHVSFHMLRHGHAKTLLQHGTDLKTISTRLGHASIQTTAKFYLGDDADLDEQAVARLNDVYRAPEVASGEQTGAKTGANGV